MYIDRERAYVVFGTLRSAHKRKEFPYDDASTPQDLVGEEIAKFPLVVQARYWFYLCMYMRGPVDSNYASKMLLQILQAEKGVGIFDPSDPRSQDADIIDEVMSKHNFTRLLKDVKKFWVFASKKLADEYSGDPREIFTGIESFEQLEERCRYKPKTKAGFMGFQKKMVSMLTYFMRDRKLITLDDFPPPVDFHLMRVMILTGIIKLEDHEPRRFRYENSSILGYDAIQGYLLRSLCDPIELGDALWLLSGNLCSLSVKNREQLAFGTMDQSVVDKAAVSKKKRLGAHPGLFDTVELELPLHISVDTLSIRNTCGRCPANRWCSGGIPAVEYYAYGLLHLREEGVVIK